MRAILQTEPAAYPTQAATLAARAIKTAHRAKSWSAGISVPDIVPTRTKSESLQIGLTETEQHRAYLISITDADCVKAVIFAPFVDIGSGDTAQ